MDKARTYKVTLKQKQPGVRTQTIVGYYRDATGEKTLIDVKEEVVKRYQEFVRATPGCRSAWIECAGVEPSAIGFYMTSQG